MPLSSWFRHVVRAFDDTYRLRLLGMMVVSLVLVLLLVHLPVHRPLAHVGWGPAGSYDPIPLSALEIADETAPESEAAATVDGAPRPTRHAGPNAAPTAPEDTPEATSTPNTTSAPPPDASPPPEPVQMDVLTEDEHPEMIGGPGSLYLNIRYPERARRQGVEGRLILGFTVTETGETRDVHVLKSLHPACDSAAVAALRSVRFRPGTRNGAPVPVHMRLPIRFRLLPGMRVSDSSE